MTFGGTQAGFAALALLGGGAGDRNQAPPFPAPVSSSFNNG